MNSASFPELPEAPRVSVFSAVYNHEQFVAETIESVLSQGWPADRLQYVVVDDGSSDRSAEIIGTYGDALTFIRQPNQGVNAAVNRAMAELTGDIVIGVAGDDVLPPGRIESAVAFFREHPRVGLCYGDVELIDGDGRLLAASFAEQEQLPTYEGRVTGKLVIANFIHGGAISFRGCLKDLVYPIPEHAAWEDWWLAYRLSLEGEIRHLPGLSYRYRQHGNNMSFGVTGERLAKLHVEEHRFRLWMLANTPRDRIDVEDALLAVDKAQYLQRLLVEQLGDVPEAVLPAMSAADRERSVAYADTVGQLLRPASSEAAAWLAVRSFGLDPSQQSGARALGAARRLWHTPTAQRARSVRASLGARHLVVAISFTDLNADPQLLEACVRAFGADDDATLWVLAPGQGEDLGEMISARLSTLQADESRWPDVHLFADISQATATELGAVADLCLVAGAAGLDQNVAELRRLAALIGEAYATDAGL